QASSRRRRQRPPRAAGHAPGPRAARRGVRVPVAPQGPHRRAGRQHDVAQPLRYGAAAQAAGARAGVEAARRRGMRAARSVCAMASLAAWTAGALASTTGFGAAAPGLSGAYASRAAYVSRAVCTAPPAPDAQQNTVPDGHDKPSPYAPQPRAPNRAYG